jgi:hypothetical protein
MISILNALKWVCQVVNSEILTYKMFVMNILRGIPPAVVAKLLILDILKKIEGEGVG